MTLHATPESVRTARRFVAERVAGCPGSIAEDAVLLVSELATNCVVHGRSDYEVRVIVDGDRVRVEVADRDPDLPELHEEGRGLHLVIDLADRWGATPKDDGPGKVVWFELG